MISIHIAPTDEHGRSEVRVTISDSGRGIPLALQEKIFEPFFQTENVLSDKPAGAGLGLSMAKSYAELHGGLISVTSKGAGQGSCFSFSLPLECETRPPG